MSVACVLLLRALSCCLCAIGLDVCYWLFCVCCVFFCVRGCLALKLHCCFVGCYVAACVCVFVCVSFFVEMLVCVFCVYIVVLCVQRRGVCVCACSASCLA